MKELLIQFVSKYWLKLSHFVIKPLPSVYLSHEVFASKSNSWAITPVLIDILNQLIKPQTRWLVVCETSSSVDWRKLLLSLHDEDDTRVSEIDLEVFRDFSSKTFQLFTPAAGSIPRLSAVRSWCNNYPSLCLLQQSINLSLSLRESRCCIFHSTTSQVCNLSATSKMLLSPSWHGQKTEHKLPSICARFGLSLIDLRFFTSALFHLLFIIRLVERLLPSFKPATDFSIDASHELALFVWNVDKNLNLKTVPYFCSRYGSECAIYARDENIYCVSWKRQS